MTRETTKTAPRPSAVDSTPPDEPLLQIDSLRTYFDTDAGTIRAVDGTSFSVDRGETVCLVGESGCGKTVTAESITRLLPMPPGRIVGGSIRFDGTELTTLDNHELRSYRGARIAHVFQHPSRSLNPVYSIGYQIRESLSINTDFDREERENRSIELLDRVGIPDPSHRVDAYPHQLSGGMQQRALIAIALAGEPDLLIADEPTTALDVTIEAEILDLFDELQRSLDMAILFITHDLGVVASIADRVVVMYAGTVVEVGNVFDLFEQPAHPYTRAMFRSHPRRSRGFEPIPGRTPDPTDLPIGCRFHPRCPHAIDKCASDGAPGTYMHGSKGHEVACIHFGPGQNPKTVLGDPCREEETTDD